MTSASTQCQRYYAISKKIPKDVKRFCGMCRQHGVMVETRGHNCSFKNCECSRCLLIRQRRRIMSTQIRLRRAQDKKFQRTSEPEQADVVPMVRADSNRDDSSSSDVNALLDAKNMCYFCQKCKNHGILMWKKDHKRHCTFAECTCEQCELIETRRRLDQHLKGARLGKPVPQKGVIEYASPMSDSSWGSCESPFMEKEINEEDKATNNISEVPQIMPIVLPVGISPGKNAMLNGVDTVPTTFSVSSNANGLSMNAIPVELSAFAALQMASSPQHPHHRHPSPLFSCSPSIAQTPTATATAAAAAAAFFGGFPSLPIEPIGGQIPEEMSAFSTFLNSVRQLETLIHHQKSTLSTMTALNF